MQATVIPLSPHRQTQSPKLQVWATHSLSHNSQKGWGGRRLPHITAPARPFLTAAPSLWPDRVWHMLQWRLTCRQTQRNIRGALAPKQSIIRGRSSLPPAKLSDDAPRMKSSAGLLFRPWVALYHCREKKNPFNWWYQQSSSFSFVFFIHCHPLSSPLLTLPPNFPPLPILYLQAFFFSFVKRIQRSPNPNITKLSIEGFLLYPPTWRFRSYPIIPTFQSILISFFFFPTSNLALILLFRRLIQPSPHLWSTP